MGQQQLLLIVLGVIIVGVAIWSGVELFAANAGARNKEIIITDMEALAQDVAAYSMRPRIFGGGGGDITHYHLSSTGPWGTNNPDANYSITSISNTSFTVRADSKLVASAFVLCTFDKAGKLTAGPFSNGFAR